MKPVLIFGASKGVGFELAFLLRECDVRVVALVRPATSPQPLQALGVEVVAGDALSPADVARAYDMLGPGGRVVSTLGGHPSAEAVSVDRQGNVLTIDLAKSRRIERYVLVTSIGCGEMMPYMSERARAAFGGAVIAKTHAEEHLRAGSLPFTIVRPGGLRSEPATGRGILSTDPEMHGFIHRADVAALVARVLTDPATVGGVYAAVDAQLARCDNPIVPAPLRAWEAG